MGQKMPILFLTKSDSSKDSVMPLHPILESGSKSHDASVASVGNKGSVASDSESSVVGRADIEDEVRPRAKKAQGTEKRLPKPYYTLLLISRNGVEDLRSSVSGNIGPVGGTRFSAQENSMNSIAGQNFYPPIYDYLDNPIARMWTSSIGLVPHFKEMIPFYHRTMRNFNVGIGNSDAPAVEEGQRPVVDFHTFVSKEGNVYDDLYYKGNSVVVNDFLQSVRNEDFFEDYKMGTLSEFALPFKWEFSADTQFLFEKFENYRMKFLSGVDEAVAYDLEALDTFLAEHGTEIKKKVTSGAIIPTVSPVFIHADSAAALPVKTGAPSGQTLRSSISSQETSLAQEAALESFATNKMGSDLLDVASAPEADSDEETGDAATVDAETEDPSVWKCRNGFEPYKTFGKTPHQKNIWLCKETEVFSEDKYKKLLAQLICSIGVDFDVDGRIPHDNTRSTIGQNSSMTKDFFHKCRNLGVSELVPSSEQLKFLHHGTSEHNLILFLLRSLKRAINEQQGELSRTILNGGRLQNTGPRPFEETQVSVFDGLLRGEKTDVVARTLARSQFGCFLAKIWRKGKNTSNQQTSSDHQHNQQSLLELTVKHRITTKANRRRRNVLLDNFMLVLYMNVVSNASQKESRILGSDYESGTSNEVLAANTSGKFSNFVHEAIRANDMKLLHSILCFPDSLGPNFADIQFGDTKRYLEHVVRGTTDGCISTVQNIDHPALKKERGHPDQQSARVRQSTSVLEMVLGIDSDNLPFSERPENIDIATELFKDDEDSLFENDFVTNRIRDVVLESIDGRENSLGVDFASLETEVDRGSVFVETGAILRKVFGLEIVFGLADPTIPQILDQPIIPQTAIPPSSDSIRVVGSISYVSTGNDSYDARKGSTYLALANVFEDEPDFQERSKNNIRLCSLVP